MATACGLRATALATLVLAATTGPVQALAAAAVGAALAGRPVATWCLLLGLATLLRTAGAYLTQLLSTATATRYDRQLQHRHLAGLLACDPTAWRDLAAAVGGRLQAVRTRAELAGLGIGAATVLATLDLRLSAIWCLTWLVIMALAMRLGDPHGAARASHHEWQDAAHWRGTTAAARLIADLRLVPMAIACDWRSAEVVRAAASTAAQVPHTKVSAAILVAGAVQTLIATWTVILAARGVISTSGAIAAILATTTAAVRCELLANAAIGTAQSRLALCRLRSLRVSRETIPHHRSRARVAIGAATPLSVPPGGSLAIIGPDARMATILAAMRGHGGIPVMLDDGRAVVTPASDPPAWTGRVAVVGERDRLAAGTVRQNLDPVGCHAEQDLVTALAHAGFPQGADRLGQELGCGGTGLSAGETLRVALARALLAKPQVIVLVDPTRTLDLRSAQRIHAAITDPDRLWTAIVIGADAVTAACCAEVAVLSQDGQQMLGPQELMTCEPARCWLRETAA